MAKLPIPEPVSGGLFLTYKCTNECRHCMYACSPRWRADWISVDDAEKILAQLSNKIHGSPFGRHEIGVNHGLHFTGGEPFINFDLLLEVTKIAHRLNIPSTFVETNCFWCIDDKSVREKLTQLRDAGLSGILISANPFVLEHIPFERSERAIRISRDVFDGNVIIYQEFFHQQFSRLDIKATLAFEEYLRKAGAHSLSYVELIPTGRACYQLEHLYGRYQAKKFFSESCREELTRPWHIHIDNYFNYITGYCGGISLGDARNLDAICQGIELDEYPIIGCLVSQRGIRKLFEFAVEEFGYKEIADGYVSKCHLCIDIRRHIVEQTDEFRELKPKEFYRNL